MKDKEKLPLYVKQLVQKGSDKIEKLSQFKKSLTIRHAEEIQVFQDKELNKIKSCRAAIILLFLNDPENEEIKQLDEMLDKYHEQVLFFANNFPVEK